MAKRKRKVGALKGIDIDEVSLVMQGANQPAFVSIIKTAGNEEEIAKRAFEECYQAMIEDEKVWRYCEDLFMSNNALRQSVSSIIHDEKEQDKKGKIFESLQQFVQVFASMVSDTDVIKSVEAIVAVAGKQEKEPEVEKVSKTIGKLTVLAALNDVQKGMFNAMDEDKQATVIKRAYSEEKGIDTEVLEKEFYLEPMKKEDDESFDMDGQKILKSEVGAASFLILKGMADRIEKSEAKAAISEKFAKEEREKRLLKEFSDDAQSRWPNLPGTPVEKGQTLQAIMALPEAIQKSQLAMLDAGNQGNSKLFKENGHSNVNDGNDPNDKLESLAKAYSEKANVPYLKAYEAVLETAEGKDLYEKTLG